MQTLGEFLVSDTIDFKFNSHSAAGAPITLAGSPEVALYAGNGTTEITSGVTLTVDHDSRTGMHHVRVDPSGLSPGQYTAVLTAGTVDGTSVVGVQVARFTLGVKNYLRPTTAGRTLDVASTGEAGIDFGNVLLPAGAIPVLGIVDNGTAQSASSTTLVLRSAASFADDALIGATILITGGSAGVGQTGVIEDYVGSTDTATIDAWSGGVTPTGTITYVIFGTAPVSGGGGASANDVRDAVLNADLSGFTSSGTVGQRLGRIPNAAAGGNGGLPTVDASNRVAGVSGNVEGSVGSVTGNVGGNVVGSVASVTGAVGSVTGNVGGTVNGLTSTAQGHVRTAAGMASANLDTQIAALATASALTGVGNNVTDIQGRIPASLDDGLMRASVKKINNTTLTNAGTGGQLIGG